MAWWRGTAAPVALCAVGLVEAWVAHGLDVSRAVLVVALVAPLCWRRSHPAIVMLFVAVAFLVQVPVERVRLLEETFTCYFALIWAAYACARHAASTGALAVGTAGPLTGGFTVGLVDRSVLSAALGVAILSVPLWAGHGVRTRVGARTTLEVQACEIAVVTAAAAAWHASRSRALIAAELQGSLTDRVRTMVDQARRAAACLVHEPELAAHTLASVEADGRAALQDMRITLTVLRGDGQRSREPSSAADLTSGASPTAVADSRRGSWVFPLGLALAATAVVGVNVIAGFTTAADYVFPLLLLSLAALGVRAVRRQSELLAAVRRQTLELQALREAAARTAVAQERVRLARELHDVVAHHLMVMVVQAGAARRTLQSGRPGASEALAAVNGAGADVISELRALLELVDPDSQTGPAHGMSELGMLVDRARASGLAVELSVLGQQRSLPGGLDLVAHRIVQESLTNVIRHAGATRARVLVHYREDRLTIEVTDDGHGLGLGPVGGLGLLGMRERAQMYGGSCSLTELPAGGVRVVATLPLEPAGALR